jgi:RHS repeat-associated protein
MGSIHPSTGVIGISAPDGSDYGFVMSPTGTITNNSNGIADVNLQLISPTGSNVSYANLLASGGQFLLTTSQGEQVLMVMYIPAGATKYIAAHPLQITYPGGYVWNFSYGSQNELDTITDSLGRSMAFQWYDGPVDSTSATYPRAIQSITMPDGSTLNYTYESYQGTQGGTTGYQRLKTYTHLQGTTVVDSATYIYDDPNTTSLLTGVVDNAGIRYSTWQYDTSGRVISAQHANGVDASTISYATSGTTFTRTVTNALGKQTIYTFSAASATSEPLLTSVVGNASANCVGTTSSITYNSNNQQASTVDTAGNETTYTYGSDGFPQTITEAAGTSQQRTTTLTWNDTYGVPAQIVTSGLTTNLIYDNAGHLLTRVETDTTQNTQPYSTNGNKRTWAYTYNALGLLSSVEDPSNNTQTFAYNSTGYLSSITNSLGQVTQITALNGRGQPLAISDANGIVTDLSYDNNGRVTSIQVNPGTLQATTQIAYNATGQITTLTQPNGVVYTFTYDAARRLATIQDSLGGVMTYTRNAMNGVTSTQITASNGTIMRSATATFDQLNRLLTQIGAANQTTAYAYDLDNNVTGVTDPLGHQYSYAYDALNRLIGETDPLKHSVAYAYDGQDHLTSFTDALGHVTSYVYDGFGDVIEQISPDSGTTVYTYGPSGLRLTEADSRGVVTAYGYDILGRLTSKSYASDTAENVTYGYDNGALGIGHLTSMTDTGGSTTFTYNALGQMTQQQHVVAGATYVTQYSYDAAGQILSITYPSGRIVSYQRDSNGRIAGITTQANAGSAAVTLASNGLYLPFGPLESFQYGSGLAYNAVYNTDYAITSLVTAQQGGASLQNLQYSYDANGNTLTIVDNLNSARSQTLGYDALNHLTSATGAYGSYVYGYDAAGNRTTGSTSTGVPQTYSYDPASNHLLSITTGAASRAFAYASSGQVEGDSRATGQVYGFHIDAAGMADVTTLNGATLLTNLYDGQQHRVEKDVPGASGTRTRFVYDDHGHLLAEIDAINGPVRDYVWLGDRPIAQFDYGVSGVGVTQMSYVHVDPLNRPQKATDASQTLTWDGVFGPFGEAGSVSGSLTMHLGFPGQYLDPETGLYQNWHRDYDSTLGRYLASDPIGLAGGLNVYDYADANPLGFTDARGLDNPGMGPYMVYPNQYGAYPDIGGIYPPAPMGSKCVQDYLHANYGAPGAWMANVGNIQQYIPSLNQGYVGSLETAGEVGAEKAVITKGPWLAGKVVANSFPSVAEGLLGASSLLSGAAELAGAILTPFGTTAMTQAVSACTCKNSAWKNSGMVHVW